MPLATSVITARRTFVRENYNIIYSMPAARVVAQYHRRSKAPALPAGISPNGSTLYEYMEQCWPGTRARMYPTAAEAKIPQLHPSAITKQENILYQIANALQYYPRTLLGDDNPAVPGDDLSLPTDQPITPTTTTTPGTGTDQQTDSYSNIKNSPFEGGKGDVHSQISAQHKPSNSTGHPKHPLSCLTSPAPTPKQTPQPNTNTKNSPFEGGKGDVHSQISTQHKPSNSNEHQKRTTIPAHFLCDNKNAYSGRTSVQQQKHVLLSRITAAGKQKAPNYCNPDRSTRKNAHAPPQPISCA